MIDIERVIAEGRSAVFGVIAQKVADPDVVEDLVQETLIRAWRSAGTFKDDDHARRWLSTTARNLAIDHLRYVVRWRRLQPSVSYDEVAYLVDTIPSEPSDDREVPSFEELTAGLTDRHRQVLHLRFVEGRSTDQMAEALGLKRQGALSLQHRAIKELRKRLDPIRRAA